MSISRDEYSVEVKGTTRQSLVSQALELASEYFELPPDKLEVLPFTANPTIQVQHGDGTIHYLTQVVGFLDVVVIDDPNCNMCNGEKGWHFSSCPMLNNPAS